MSTGAAARSGRSLAKSAIQGTVVYSIPLIGQRVASILLLFVVTRVLTPADFGMLALLDQVLNVLSILLGGQFSSALGYFYFKSESPEDRARVVGTAFGGALAIGCVAALASFPAAGLLARHIFHDDQARRYLPIVFLSMPFNFLVEAIFGWLRITERQKAFAVGSLLRLCITVAGIGILVGILKLRVMAYLATNIASLVIAAAVFAIYVFRTTHVRWSGVLFGRMLRFSLPLGMSWIAMFVINFGDQFVLPQYRSLAEVGVYSLACRVGMLVSVAIASFFSYWNAQVYRLMRREDAEVVFARFLTYCVLMVALCSLMLTLFARPALWILVSPAFRPAAALIPLLVAANAVRAIGEFLRTRFLADGRPRYDSYCTCAGMAVCAPLYFLLIPRYGMWGAGAATLLTLVFMAVLSAIWTYRTRPYRVEFERLIKLGGVTAGILVLYYTTPVASLPAQIAWSALLLSLLPVGLLLLGFATPEERRAVRSFAAKFARTASAGA
jgi:O-antigen/teichoic acid export membrane protein